VLAVVAGLGFGAFIDEIGKFLTSDNNYFFQPAIALIYVIFVALFLLARAVERRAALSEPERLANALDLLREGAVRGLTTDERERADAYLASLGEAHPLAGTLRATLAAVARRDEQRPAVIRRVTARGSAFTRHRVESRWFPRALIAFFALDAAFALGGMLTVIVSDPAFRPGDPALSFVDWGDGLATAAAAALSLTGVVHLRRSRQAAYPWFKRATLISIFLIQFFSFYQEQLLALGGLTQDVLVLMALNYLIHHDQPAAPEQPTPARPGRPTLLPRAGRVR
jgi:hypothetical protein